VIVPQGARPAGLPESSRARAAGLPCLGMHP
jgi:hypothetical protein